MQLVLLDYFVTGFSLELPNSDRTFYWKMSSGFSNPMAMFQLSLQLHNVSWLFIVDANVILMIDPITNVTSMIQNASPVDTSTQKSRGLNEGPIKKLTFRIPADAGFCFFLVSLFPCAGSVRKTVMLNLNPKTRFRFFRLFRFCVIRKVSNVHFIYVQRNPGIHQKMTSKWHKVSKHTKCNHHKHNQIKKKTRVSL